LLSPDYAKDRPLLLGAKIPLMAAQKGFPCADEGSTILFAALSFARQVHKFAPSDADKGPRPAAGVLAPRLLSAYRSAAFRLVRCSEPWTS
jgi:hypothetical protein